MNCSWLRFPAPFPIASPTITRRYGLPARSAPIEQELVTAPVFISVPIAGPTADLLLHLREICARQLILVLRGGKPIRLLASSAVVLHRLLQCGSHTSILGQGHAGRT